MKILISGSNGFVGSNLCNHLKNNFIEVITLKRSDFNQKLIDISDANIVIHLAGKAHDLKNSTNEKEYFIANYEITKKLYDAYLKSNFATCFIYFSSVKAVADQNQINMIETQKPSPNTAYGRSKLKSEDYITSNKPVNGKRYYILRPSMIHGPGNKGNLNLLYKLITSRIPWLLGKLNNSRSLCSIDNLLFVLDELILNSNISSGIYNICDSEPLSTNEIVNTIADVSDVNLLQLNLPKKMLFSIVKVLKYCGVDISSFEKLTENYTVSNYKIITAIGKELPLTSMQGLIKTIKYFNKNYHIK
jgi:nucleoside-diphosphate-sugar epimerase